MSLFSDFLHGSNNTTTETKTMDPRTQQYAQWLQSLAGGLPGPGGVPLQGTAGFTPDQLASFQNIRNAQGAFNPDMDAARALTTEVGKGLNTQGVNDLYGRLSGPLLAQLQNQQQMQMKNATLGARNTAGGDASRVGVVQGVLGGQQNLATGSLQSNLFGQSVGAYQNDLAQKLAASQSMNAAAAERQGLTYQDIFNQYASGSAQQNLTQSQMNNLFAQQQGQYQNPYQNFQAASSILPGLTNAYGYTDTKTVPSQNLFTTLLGGVGAGLGKAAGNYGGNKGSNTNATSYRGGRIGFDDGGSVDDEIFKTDKYDAHPSGGGGAGIMGDILGMGSKAISGLGSLMGGAGAEEGAGEGAAELLPLLAVFQGGRIGYAGGGSVGKGSLNPIDPHYQAPGQAMQPSDQMQKPSGNAPGAMAPPQSPFMSFLNSLRQQTSPASSLPSSPFMHDPAAPNPVGMGIPNIGPQPLPPMASDPGAKTLGGGPGGVMSGPNQPSPGAIGGTPIPPMMKNFGGDPNTHGTVSPSGLPSLAYAHAAGGKVRRYADGGTEESNEIDDEMFRQEGLGMLRNKMGGQRSNEEGKGDALPPPQYTSAGHDTGDIDNMANKGNTKQYGDYAGDDWTKTSGPGVPENMAYTNGELHPTRDLPPEITRGRSNPGPLTKATEDVQKARGVNPMSGVISSVMGALAHANDRTGSGHLKNSGISGALGLAGQGYGVGEEQSNKEQAEAAKEREAQLRQQIAERPYKEMTAFQKAEMAKPVPIMDNFGQVVYGVRDPNNPTRYLDPLTGKQIQGKPTGNDVSGNGGEIGNLPKEIRDNLPEGVNAQVLADNPHEAATVRAVAEGRQNLMAIPMKQRRHISDLVNAYDKDFDQTVWRARNDQRADFGTKGNAGKLLLAVNQVLPHWATSAEKFEKLANSNIPAANTIKNWWLTQTGDPRIGQFEVAKEVAAMDTARLLRGTGAMAEKDIDFWRQKIRAASSPAQAIGMMQTVADDLIKARLSSIEHGWRMVMKNTSPVPQMMSEDAKTGLKSINEINDRVQAKFNAPKGAAAPPKENKEALDWLKANPDDPDAPAVRKKLGIQ